jgi:hypothetical protein
LTAVKRLGLYGGHQTLCWPPNLMLATKLYVGHQTLCWPPNFMLATKLYGGHQTPSSAKILNEYACYGMLWDEVYIYLLFAEVTLTLASSNNSFIVNYNFLLQHMVNVSVIQGGYFLLQVIEI